MSPAELARIDNFRSSLRALNETGDDSAGSGFGKVDLHSSLHDVNDEDGRVHGGDRSSLLGNDAMDAVDARANGGQLNATQQHQQQLQHTNGNTRNANESAKHTPPTNENEDGEVEPDENNSLFVDSRDNMKVRLKFAYEIISLVNYVRMHTIAT